eukprot:scaffold2385_cov126-Isochrysis_galbana.AAC.6
MASLATAMAQQTDGTTNPASASCRAWHACIVEPMGLELASGGVERSEPPTLRRAMALASAATRPGLMSATSRSWSSSYASQTASRRRSSFPRWPILNGLPRTVVRLPHSSMKPSRTGSPTGPTITCPSGCAGGGGGTVEGVAPACIGSSRPSGSISG